MATSTTIDTSTAAAFIPEMWSAKTLDARNASMVMGKLIDTSYEKELSYGDVLHVTQVGAVAVEDKTRGFANPITWGNDQTGATNQDITVNSHIYCAFLEEDVVAIQSKVNLMDKLTKAAGAALAVRYDADVSALVAGLVNSVGTPTVPLTDANVRAGKLKLDLANVPEDSRYFVYSAEQENEFLDEEKYVNQQYRGSRGPAAIEQAKFARIYGMDWYKSTNLADGTLGGHDNVIFHKEALAGIIQLAPKVVKQYIIESLAEGCVTHMLYGVAEMRDNHAVRMNGL